MQSFALLWPAVERPLGLLSGAMGEAEEEMQLSSQCLHLLEVVRARRCFGLGKLFRQLAESCRSTLPDEACSTCADSLF